MEIKDMLQKVIKECGGVVLVDKSNDNAFSVLFSVGACNKKPVADDDMYGKHILLERFFKAKTKTDIKSKLYEMPVNRAESALLYYTKTAKTLLEFFYRNGYHEEFSPTEGVAVPQLALVEHEEYFDLYAYYAYKEKGATA